MVGWAELLHCNLNWWGCHLLLPVLCCAVCWRHLIDTRATTRYKLGAVVVRNGRCDTPQPATRLPAKSVSVQTSGPPQLRSPCVRARSRARVLQKADKQASWRPRRELPPFWARTNQEPAQTKRTLACVTTRRWRPLALKPHTCPKATRRWVAAAPWHCQWQHEPPTSWRHCCCC